MRIDTAATCVGVAVMAAVVALTLLADIDGRTVVADTPPKESCDTRGDVTWWVDHDCRAGSMRYCNDDACVCYAPMLNGLDYPCDEGDMHQRGAVRCLCMASSVSGSPEWRCEQASRE